MTEDISVASMHPFIQAFVLNIVKNIKNKNYGEGAGEVIDTDFIPRFSENVMIASMGMGIVNAGAVREEPKVKLVPRDMSELARPIEEPVSKVESVQPMKQALDVRGIAPARPATRPPVHIRPMETTSAAQIVHSPVQASFPPVRNVPVVVPKNIQTIAPVSTRGEVDFNKYGKLAPLLGDPSVSTIECLGKDKELMIIRAGQKQKTRISLGAEEIKEFLELVANDAHVPLIEGVFRVSVPGFNINAVVSEMVGSRFVVKKSTAYGLLE